MRFFMNTSFFNNFYSPLSQFEVIFATTWFDHIFLLDKETEADFIEFWLTEISPFAIIFSSILYTFLGGLFSSVFFILLFKERLSIIPQTSEEIIRNYYFQLLDDFIRSGNTLGFQAYYIFYIELIISIFYYNFSGLTPFGFTITSHFYISFTLAFSIFFGLNFIGIYRRKWKFLSNFLPQGTIFELIGLVIFLEIISYFSRLFSLSIRLFANIIAGHTMLKIIASFIVSAIFSGGLSLIPAFICLNGLIILFVIEMVIAALQLYVFITLVFIYINEGIKGNH